MNKYILKASYIKFCTVNGKDICIQDHSLSFPLKLSISVAEIYTFQIIVKTKSAQHGLFKKNFCHEWIIPLYIYNFSTKFIRKMHDFIIYVLGNSTETTTSPFPQSTQVYSPSSSSGKAALPGGVVIRTL